MKWLKILGIAIIGVLGIGLFTVFFRRDEKFLDWVGQELDVIDAEAAAKKDEARLGHATAIEKIKFEHKEALEQLDEEAKQEIDRLANDGAPAGELAKRILRSAGKARRRGIMSN